MKQKFQETLGTRYQEDAVLAKLNELISSQLGNNYFSSGGGKRTLRKKRNVRKRKQTRK
jgi:hypothetical protein